MQMILGNRLGQALVTAAVVVAGLILGFLLARLAPHDIESKRLIVTSGVTLIGTLLVAYYAALQARTARAKVNLDLFDRRYAIFKNCIDLLDQTRRQPWRLHPTPPLRSDIAMAMFLFEDDVAHFLTQVQMYVTKVNQLSQPDKSGLSDIPIEPFLQWVSSDAYGLAKKAFKPYLDFSTLR